MDIGIMSKKRQRPEKGESTPVGTTLGPDPTIEAEALLFELAPDDNANFAATGGEKPSAKRSKPDNTGGVFKDTKQEATDDKSTPAATHVRHSAAIAPSSSLRLCDGCDVVLKGGRGRGRQLMVLPGALGLGNAGGQLGTLKNITTPSPILYVEFPEGRLKCTGRTVHTKGRFFTLYADKTASKATRMDCRDVFDSIVFFHCACWVGTREENPDEEPLPLPTSLEWLPVDPERPDAPPADFKTHFGGGNPNFLLSQKSSKRLSTKTEAEAVGDEAAGGPDEEVNEEGLEAERSNNVAVAQPTRRSGRARKSTVTYVDDSDNFGESDEDGIMSISSDGSDDEDSAGGGGSEGRDGGGVESGEGEEKDDGDGGIQEDVSILDGPQAKEQFVDQEAAEEAAASFGGETPTSKTPSPSKGNGGSIRGSSKKTLTTGARADRVKSKTAAGTSASSAPRVSRNSPSTSNSSDGEAGGESFGEETPAPVNDQVSGQAAQPSRRSRRSSAVARVKYTQTSGSEAEEEDKEEIDGSD